MNPTSTSDCGYCQYRDGMEYMSTLGIKPVDKWSYMGVFLAICLGNWALVYFFIYTVRIRIWSFGIGTLFRGLGKRVDAVRGIFARKM